MVLDPVQGEERWSCITGTLPIPIYALRVNCACFWLVGVLDSADRRDGDIRGIIQDMDMMTLMGRSIRSIEGGLGLYIETGLKIVSASGNAWCPPVDIN
jgi:hypothetical protein